jgi:cytoskeletal protein RodZ
MSQLRSGKFRAYASSFVVAGMFAGVVASAGFADSEASYQASTESAEHQSSSMNTHAGESENTRQAETQAGTGSVSEASHSSQSESSHEAPNPAMNQPSLTPPAGVAGTPAVHNKTTAAAPGSAPGTLTPRAGQKTGAIATHIPHAKAVSYHWGRTRGTSKSRVNRPYMVQTVDQAAR